MLKGEIARVESINGGLAVGVTVIGGKPYEGSYEITPSTEVQTLDTKDRILAEQLIINPIPSNYGRISYNGLALTVE